MPTSCPRDQASGKHYEKTLEDGEKNTRYSFPTLKSYFAPHLSFVSNAIQHPREYHESLLHADGQARVQDRGHKVDEESANRGVDLQLHPRDTVDLEDADGLPAGDGRRLGLHRDALGAPLPVARSKELRVLAANLGDGLHGWQTSESLGLAPGENVEFLGRGRDPGSSWRVGAGFHDADDLDIVFLVLSR